MKVLILSVTAGYGHHATAQAIGDMLKNKGAEVDTLDVYAYISNLIKTTIDKGYLFSSKHMQTLYRLVYQLAKNNGASYFSSAPSIINIINALGATKFARVISDREPDVIICTHVFAAQMVDELKKRKKLADIMTIGIVTGLHAPSVLGGCAARAVYRHGERAADLPLRAARRAA